MARERSEFEELSGPALAGEGKGEMVPGNEQAPLRFYLRDIGGMPRWDHERHIKLSQTMEEAREEFFAIAKCLPPRWENTIFGGGARKPQSADLWRFPKLQAFCVALRQFEREGPCAFLEKTEGAWEKFMEARRELIERNLRLVIPIAKRFRDFHGGCSLSDRINEGNIGLMTAVDLFRSRMGYRFSTYARWWIRQAILVAIVKKSRIVKILHGDRALMWPLRETARVLAHELGREPTREEIARRLQLPLERVEDVLVSSKPIESLDATYTDEDDECPPRIVRIPSKDGSPEEACVKEDVRERVRALVRTLPGERDQEILTLRFGLDGKGERSVEEVGDMFGVTGERVRQIENKTLGALRARVRRLPDFPQK